MDVSPRALRAVTFRTSVRGYNVDDVDQFLERVAEGVAALQAKLDAAVARAEKAETERAAATEGEDAVQRTLVLAQRTADLALKEAKEEGARIVADARTTADRETAEAQRQLRADLERLEAARKQLHTDVTAMQQYVEHERTRVRNSLADLLRKIDSTARRPPAPPIAAKVDVPQVVKREAAAPDPGAPEPAEPASAPVDDAELVAARPEPAPEREPERLPERGREPERLPERGREPERLPERGREPERLPERGREPELEEPPARVRREPQPPPVSHAPFATAARVGGRPAGPPPGPRRFALSEESGRTDQPTDENVDDTPAEGNDQSGLRRLFGR